MPRDLFGDVTRPSISIGNRKWYTVPVSLLSHAAIVAMIVIVPLLAAPLMPSVLDDTMSAFVTLVPPTPPPAPIIKKPELKPIENVNAAPTQAPTGIKDEPEVINDTPPDRPGIFLGDTIDTVVPTPPVVVAKAPPPLEPVRIGGTIRQPQKVHNVDPVYPAIAQAARVQGIVILEATLAPDGRISNARILRSIPLLDQAALDAVRQWQYTPTLLNGEPVPVIMTITVMFTLSK
jgi:periplasmic protein TonB